LARLRLQISELLRRRDRERNQIRRVSAANFETAPVIDGSCDSMAGRRFTLSKKRPRDSGANAREAYRD
jgi:hypothetical protein